MARPRVADGGTASGYGAKVERQPVSKQVAQLFDAERFNLKKLSELEVRKQYQIKISNRFAALENLNVSEDINTLKRVSKSQLKTV
jgi:hypothetical protein